MNNYQTLEDALTYPTLASAHFQLNEFFGKDEGRKVSLYIVTYPDNTAEFCWATLEGADGPENCKAIFPFANPVFVEGGANLTKVEINFIMVRKAFCYRYIFDENYGAVIKKINAVPDEELAKTLSTLLVGSHFQNAQVVLAKVTPKSRPDQLICYAWNVWKEDDYLLIPTRYQKYPELAKYDHSTEIIRTLVNIGDAFIEDGKEYYLDCIDDKQKIFATT